MIAARAMAPKEAPTVGLAHLHAPAVSVREQAALIGARLRRDAGGVVPQLVADADSTLVVVARFLALLELFREAAITFEQAEALGELTVRWTGPRRARSRSTKSSTSPTSCSLTTDDRDRPRAPEAPMRDREPRGRRGAARPRSSSRSTSRLPGGIHGAIEAVLMVVDEPVTSWPSPRRSSSPSPTSRRRWPSSRPETREQHRGFTLRQVGGGWRMYSRDEYAPVVEKFVLDGQQARLTQASLETLAVIAYRQPVSRSRVARSAGSTSTA